jgi:predicted regulator of Ras-like GTPase activity (Roadblock/LC7/MglB family)
MADLTTGSPLMSAPRGSRARDLRQALGRLRDLPRVRGALVVAPDGLVIAAELPTGVAVDPLAALASTLGRELELRGPRLRRGTFVTAHFAAEGGSVHLGATPVGFIVVLADPGVDRDAVSRQLRTVRDALARAWTRPPI